MTPRLLILLGGTSAKLDSLRGALAEVLDRAELPSPSLRSPALPRSLVEQGFQAVSVIDDQLSADSPALRLAPHLRNLSRVAARSHRGEVLAIFVHLEKLHAEACFYPPGGFARTVEGDPFEVLRQAAAWMEADPHVLHPLFCADAEDAEGDSPPDEEDLFVQSRLDSARTYMTRFRRVLL